MNVFLLLAAPLTAHDIMICEAAQVDLKPYAEGRFRLRQHGTLHLLCILFRPARRKRNTPKAKTRVLA
jgi:hypothetical protein